MFSKILYLFVTEVGVHAQPTARVAGRGAAQSPEKSTGVGLDSDYFYAKLH